MKQHDEVDDSPRAAGPATQARRPPLSRSKSVLFSAVAAGLFFLLLEALLRVFGFGGFPPFFKTVLVDLYSANQARVLRIDQGAMWPYFGRKLDGMSRLLIGSTVAETIMMPKPPGTVRVFLVGESTVQGFPHPPNLTAASFLEKFLQARAPDKKVEVINCGVTAVASYPLRQIVREVVRLDADLVILYAGHNEFFGAFGVASRQAAGTQPWQMALSLWARGMAIPQAMRLGMDKLAARTADDAPPEDGGLMSRMAAVEFIAPDSPLRRRAEESLAASVDEMIREARTAGVPLMMCSLTANERDLEPVRSMEPPPDVAPAWADIHRTAMDAFSSGPLAAQAGLQQALELWPQHAESRFYLARTYELEGRSTEALEQYRLARDLDAMPWRAPTRLNEVLRARAEAGGIPFADIDGAFHAEAGGAPGWQLFADHLHPSLEGQALLARALTEAIEKDKLLPVKPAATDDWRKVAKTLGDNRLSRYYTANMMMGLFQRPPLDQDEPGSNRWRRETERAFNECEEFEKAAIRRLEELMKSGSGLPNLSYLGGEEGMKAGRYAEAAEYFGSAYNAARRYSEERVIASARLFTAALYAGRYGDGVRRAATRSLADANLVTGMEMRHPKAVIEAAAVLAMLSGNATAQREWMAVMGDAGRAEFENNTRDLRAALARAAAASTGTITLENGEPAPQNAR